MKQNQFLPKVREQLKHYVYLYIDPRDSGVFYVSTVIVERAGRWM